VYGHKLEGLELRIQRHLNKLQMRESRATRRPQQGELLSEEESRVIDELRGSREPLDPGFPPSRDPFFNQ